MDTWRLILDPPLPGAQNMARDHAILDLHPQTQQPTLRLYRWAPPCVSLGLAQRWARDVDHDACRALGFEVVRRPTGGRAILHQHEVTYAVITGLDHPVIERSSVVRSYRAISTALQAGLAELGVHSAFEPEGPRRSHTRSAFSAACFDQPADYEITVDGRKLIGSAQARQRDGLLQHGSVLLHADAALWARALRLLTARDAADLRQRMIGLDEVLGRSPSFDEVAAALVRGFETTWKIKLVPGELTEAEQARATQLVEERYANLEWTQRR